MYLLHTRDFINQVRFEKVVRMKIIICLDDKNGMLFNKRRQSSDRVLCQRILSMVGDRILWMNEYSRKLFEGENGNIQIDEGFLKHAGEEDYCFIENLDTAPYIPDATEVIIYRWNRVYPADMRFPMHLLSAWNKMAVSEFQGHSHDKITQEVYRR